MVEGRIFGHTRFVCTLVNVFGTEIKNISILKAKAFFKSQSSFNRIMNGKIVNGE